MRAWNTYRELVRTIYFAGIARTDDTTFYGRRHQRLQDSGAVRSQCADREAAAIR